MVLHSVCRFAAIAAVVLAAPAALAQGFATVPPPSPEVRAALDNPQGDEYPDLKRLADGGNVEAQMYLGIQWAFRSRDAGHARQGCRYLEAASTTSANGQHLLAESYQYGRCGQKDLEKAVATFIKAAERGHTKSWCAAGNVLIEQKRDLTRAVSLCRKAAEAGDPDAQTDLGNFYLQGVLVPKDMGEARRLYEKAATQGQRNAALVLGQIYWNGDGVPRDVPKAVELWRLAYEKGRQDAAFHLGNAAWVMSQRGDRHWDPAGLDEAAAWYDKAIDALGEDDRKVAIERRDLARQLAAVMRKK